MTLALVGMGCADSGPSPTAVNDASDTTSETGAETGAETGNGVIDLSDVIEGEGPPTGPLSASVPLLESPETGLMIVATSKEDHSLEVTIRGIQLTDLFGVAFHLIWDPAILQLDSMTASSPLTTNIPSETLLHEREAGRVIYGTARFHESNWGQFDYQGVDLSDANFATLHFSLLSAGETEIAFRELGRDVRSADLKPVENLAWIGQPITVAHQKEEGR
jgi:hypothetical protein